MPQGLFNKENDDFSAILKNIVDLENGDIANSREVQLESSSSQDPSHERDAPRQLYLPPINKKGNRLNVLKIQEQKCSVNKHHFTFTM